jgi:cell division protease FtsH
MQHDKMVKNAADPVPNETPGADTPPVPTGPQMLMNVLTWVLVVSSLMYLWTNVTTQPYHSIPYSDFKQELISDNIEQISVKESEINGSFRIGISDEDKPANIHQRFRTIVPSFGDTELLTLLESKQVAIQSIAATTPLWISIVLSIAPWLVLIAFSFTAAKWYENLSAVPVVMVLLDFPNPERTISKPQISPLVTVMSPDWKVLSKIYKKLLVS